MKTHSVILTMLLPIAWLGLSLGSTAARAEARASQANPTPPVNKLLYMNRLFYLPFDIDFQEGKTPDDILPFLDDRYGQPDRLLTADELQRLESEWNDIKDGWAKKSLLLTTPVPIHQSVHITQHLISHHITLSRTAFERLSIPDQIQVNRLLAAKPPEVQDQFRQLTFLKSFLASLEEERFNFFMVSASWCESCRQYRVLLETYAKTFPDSGLNLHSVVVEDPQEEIFDSQFLKELFPNPKKYSHYSIPRFVALQTVKGKTQVWEEGEALSELYRRFFKDHRGFLDSKTTLFRNYKRPTPTRTSGDVHPVDPSLTWLAK